MRYPLLLLFVYKMCSAQLAFQPGYFMEKYDLSLPSISEDMLKVGHFSHSSNTVKYFYDGNKRQLDSVISLLTIEGFKPSRSVDKYSYHGDTVNVRSVSLSIPDGDTLNNNEKTYTADFRRKDALDHATDCIWRTHFDKRGIKILEVRKCPQDDDFRGQVYHLVQREEFIDKYKEKNGVIDSSTIRRYYLTAFDSVVADFMVKEGKDPFIVRLNTYGEDKRKTMSYGFGIYTKNFEVVEMDKYTYTDQGKLHRVYHFEVKNGDPNLVNYTEYEYDILGRKARVTTRVEPERRSQKEKPENVGK